MLFRLCRDKYKTQACLHCIIGIYTTYTVYHSYRFEKYANMGTDACYLSLKKVDNIRLALQAHIPVKSHSA